MISTLATSTPFPTPLSGFSQIRRYWDSKIESIVAKILPGEFYVTSHNEMIATVLGSCVSACIWDESAKIGGMNHFMLPEDGQGGGHWIGEIDTGKSARYGEYAMEKLINEILKHGGKRQNLGIKIFGGGRVLANTTDIGSKNIEFVHRFIETEGMRLVAEDTGDIYPRKVHFFPQNGKVRVKKIRDTHNDTILNRERHYIQELKQDKVAGSIELF